MKTLTHISFIALLCSGLLFLLYGCKDKPLKLDESLIVDLTEEFIALPDKEDIKQTLPANKQSWEGYNFRMVAITDVDLAPVYTASLPSGNWYFGDVTKHNKETKRFFSDIDTAFDKMNATTVGYVQSSVYIPFAKELIRLSQSHAERRIAIIYSDLIEHSTLADFYQKSTLLQMQNNPDLVWEKLQKKIPLPDLTGIEVQIIYQPRNAEENMRFSIVSEFFRRQLEQKGVKVTISANLIL